MLIASLSSLTGCGRRTKTAGWTRG
ncbi:hypothetical protein AB0305_04690 [Arthrobacter sp. NPDC080086]